MIGRSGTRLLAYGVCALSTAACGDVLVEASQNAGLFGTTAIDADHQGVLPVLGVAALLLAALAFAVARDRLAKRRGAGVDPLAELARDLARTPFRSHLATIVVAALALVFVTEGYEQRFGGALPFDPTHATLADAGASLGLYVASATLVTLVLAVVVRALASTCDALAAAVGYFASLFERAFDDRASRRAPVREAVARAPFFRLSGPFGDRAPPRGA